MIYWKSWYEVFLRPVLGQTRNFPPVEFPHCSEVRVSGNIIILSSDLSEPWSSVSLVLFILGDGPEEVGELPLVATGDGPLRAVADDEGPVVLGDPRYGLHSVGTSRAWSNKFK